jgi:DNA-binding MarR family transcriptional regulator
MTLSTPHASLNRKTVEEVRDTCLCFASQRAARLLARRFDQVFAHLGITNGQYSMMVAVAGMGAPKLGRLAGFLGMDHTTVTAAVKALDKRGLLTLRPDPDDGRARLASLTDEGQALLARAVPLWRAEHARLEGEIGEAQASALRSGLSAVVG